jgi:hypothetical protein
VIKTKVVREQRRLWIKMYEMEIGDIGIVTEGNSSVQDHIVLRTRDSIISLTDPEKTWLLPVLTATLNIVVKLLPQGAELSIRII